MSGSTNIRGNEDPGRKARHEEDPGFRFRNEDPGFRFRHEEPEVEGHRFDRSEDDPARAARSEEDPGVRMRNKEDPGRQY